MTAIVLSLLLAGLPTPGYASPRELYDARVFASVPAGDRGYIEGIAFDGSDVYSGTAFGSTGTVLPLSNLGVPSQIYSWDRTTGQAHEPIVVEGEDTNHEHGVTGLKFDRSGRLYVLSNQLGLLRFSRTGSVWTQEAIVEIPDIPTCTTAPDPCSPTFDDRGPLGNDMTWDRRGNLYISDSFQATIWRVSPAGDIEPWFQSGRMYRLFGPNGIRITPDGRAMAIAVTGPDSADLGVVDRGSRVLSVPFPDPYAAEPEDILVLPNGQSADGIAYGRGGLYVLSNAGNTIFIVRADGTSEQVSNDDLRGDARMDFPASPVFDGTGALLIANYAWMDGQTPQGSRTVIDVWVGDRGISEPSPRIGP